MKIKLVLSNDKMEDGLLWVLKKMSSRDSSIRKTIATNGKKIIILHNKDLRCAFMELSEKQNDFIQSQYFRPGQKGIDNFVCIGEL